MLPPRICSAAVSSPRWTCLRAASAPAAAAPATRAGRARRLLPTAATAPAPAPTAPPAAVAATGRTGMSSRRMVRPAFFEPHTAQVWKLAPLSGPRRSCSPIDSSRWASVIFRLQSTGSAVASASSMVSMADIGREGTLAPGCGSFCRRHPRRGGGHRHLRVAAGAVLSRLRCRRARLEAEPRRARDPDRERDRRHRPDARGRQRAPQAPRQARADRARPARRGRRRAARAERQARGAARARGDRPAARAEERAPPRAAASRRSPKTSSVDSLDA